MTPQQQVAASWRPSSRTEIYLAVFDFDSGLWLVVNAYENRIVATFESEFRAEMEAGRRNVEQMVGVWS